MAEIQKYGGENVKIQRFIQQLEGVNFRNHHLGNRDGKKNIFDLKITDIEVKLYARYFIKISRLEIIRLCLDKEDRGQFLMCVLSFELNKIKKKN